MNRSTLAILIVLALLAASAAVLLSGPAVQASENPGQDPGAGNTSREPATEADGPGRQGSRSEVEVETVEPSDLTQAGPVAGLPERFLRGLVLDAEYQPVAEAWVFTDQEVEPVKTAEDGSFEIALQHPFGPSDGRSLIAWKEGMSVVEKYVRQLEDNLLLLRVDEGQEIQVLDAESGLPIAGAEVSWLMDAAPDATAEFFDLRNFASLPREVQITGPDGKCQVPDPEKSDDYIVEIRKEGYVKRYLDQWNFRRAKEIRLAKPEELRMRFVNRDGEPHAGARLCFPWYRQIVTLDEDGWADLPPEARWGFWSVQLRDDGTQWVWAEVEDNQIQPGATLVTDWRDRRGRLHVQGDEKADVFEVATSAAWERWGWQQYMPEPRWGDTPLDWIQVDPDGSFMLENGWQGETTFLHVRRVGSEGVLLSEKLVGDGPYELTLSAAAQVAIEVRCPRPEILEGAAVKFSGRETNHEQTVTLSATRAELRLPADRYRCRLILANAAHELPLDELVVIGLDMEYVFHFEGVRTLSGILTAGGKPVFPCRLDLRGDDGFSMRTETRPDGSWAVAQLPRGELRLQARPEDEWIAPVEGSYLFVPPMVERFDHDYEVATLLLSLGSFPVGPSEQIRIRRRARAAASRGPQAQNQRFSSSSPSMPDMQGGPVEIALTPGQISFDAERTGLALADLELELGPGDVRSFVLETLPTTVTSVVVEGFEQSLWGNVDWEPIAVPLLEEYPGFVPQEARSASPRGRIGNAEHLLPGRWRLRLRAPFWSNEVRGQVGQGTIDAEVQIDGSSTVIPIRFGPDDRIELAGDDSG